MATLSREMSIFIDVAKIGGPNCALNGLTSAPRSDPFCFMAGDVFGLSLLFRATSPTNGVSTVVDLDADFSIVFAAKNSAGSLLFSASGFLFDDSTADHKYTADLSVNTVEVEAALALVQFGGSIPIFIDIEVRDSANTERVTFRAAGMLYKQVYSGEVSPTEIGLPAAVLVAPDASRWVLGVSNDGQVEAMRIL